MNGWLKRLGLDRPELRAWAMYDWANSAMVCTIITAVFPIYYSSVACDGMKPEDASRLVRPTDHDRHGPDRRDLAAARDHRRLQRPQEADARRLPGARRRRRCAGMFFIYQGDWILASVLFILANIGANGSYVFYDALLPHIARDDEIDRVSTAGYALGYLGGGALLALNLAWIIKPEWFGLPSGDGADAGPGDAAGSAGVPVGRGLVAGLLDPAVSPRARAARPSGCRRAIAAASCSRSARRSTGWSRPVGRSAGIARPLMLLVAFLIYNDGIGTIMRMATIYATEMKFDQGVTIASIVLVQFVGIPFAFLFGMLAGRIGAKRSIGLGLLVYAVICIFGYFMKTERHFLILAILVGTVQGGTQALSRSLFASLIPRDKSGEFFGFFGSPRSSPASSGRRSSPGSTSSPARAAGRSSSIIAFFVVGGLLLALVDVEEGQRLARAEEKAAGIDAPSELRPPPTRILTAP